MKAFHLILLHLCTLSASSYRILTLLTLANKSNMNYFDAINLELAKKGHFITVISPMPSAVKHENIQDLKGLDFANTIKKLGDDKQKTSNFVQMRLDGKAISSLFLLHKVFSSDCETFYQLPTVQNIIHGSEKYDMVLTMAFMNECVYGLIHHLNTSSVLIGTIPTMPWHAEMTGAPTILSFVPHTYWHSTTDMSFFERLGNVVSYVYQISIRNYAYVPAIEDVYKKYIPNAPSVHEIGRNFSLVLGAGHSSFGPKRPTMPDLIDDIGGIHCRPAQPLPQEIKQMITNDAHEETDFIFFSFGSLVQGHHLPDSLRNAFLNTFSKLEGYNVLWKWEAEFNGSVKLPPNVRISKWFPQQDVLGHPKCKLFITHGGLSSLHEAIYHGVPVIAVPFFGDQDWNTKHIEDAGIGIKLEISDITEELFTKTISRVLNEPRFAADMKKRSELFRDRQSTALETAVWWIEYVLRHDGATHLRSPARYLGVFQYYCIDLIAFVVTSLLIFLTAINFIACRLLKKCQSPRNANVKLKRK